MKPINKILKRVGNNNNSEKNLYNDSKYSGRAKTGNNTERYGKDWREWYSVKKQRNEELIKQVERNNVQKIRELLNSKLYGDLTADVNALGPSEMTPLHLAAKLGYQEAAAVLLDAEADVESRNKACKTPLHYGCQYNRTQVVKMLLAAKANYLARDANDNTPLHLSVEMGQRESSEVLLSKFGYKQLQMKNKLGKYPHELADEKLGPLFAEVEGGGGRMPRMPVYDTQDETVRKMFSHARLKKEGPEANTRLQDAHLNLDKRIHKILDSIRSKKDVPDLEKSRANERQDSYRSSRSDSHSRSNRSVERDKEKEEIFERSTTDTTSTSHLKTENSMKYMKDYYALNNTTGSEGRQGPLSTNDTKLSDKLKTKRNIINCVSKTETTNSEAERPYSAPLKKYVSNTDRSGKAKSDYYTLLRKKQEEEAEAKAKSKTSATPREKSTKLEEFDQSQIKSKNSVEVSKSEDCSGELKKASPEDFVAHTVLGKGSFGEVYLVQKKAQEGFYAMKILRKAKIMGRNLTRYALTERNILTYVTHPFIVELFYAFQTSEKLFLIMEYCPCGDLGQILHKLKKFDENTAKFYIAEILLAIEHLHAHHIVYRDLKPDNVVLDRAGHAKLTDFGLSKEDIDDNTNTASFCGSVAYLAPEMLNKSGHGKSVDWYLLGVLLYEMLNGIPPYFDQDREKMFEKIKSHKLKYHASLSPTAVDLLKQLLERNPAKRLGSNGDGDEVRKHAFFDGIDWNYVRQKKYKPPLMINKRVNLNKNPVEVTSKDPTSRENYIDGWSFVNPSVD